MAAIEQALEALFVANPWFEEIERSRDVFCPFEAIGMVRQEIRHGHFLAYCLDPQRPHGFGAECLKAVLRSAAYARQPQPQSPASGNITLLDVHLMNFASTQIRREWRRIDLLAIVNDAKLVVAIELKIEASEHGEQLHQYKTRVTQNWPVSDGWRHLFLFLTKYGDEASDTHGGGWLALPLESVAHELQDVIRHKIGTPDAIALLQAYLNMLRRHHLSDKRLEDLASNLWSQHKEALEFLMERRPDSASQFFGQIYERRNEIAARMSDASGLAIIADDCTPRIARFAVKTWDNLPDFSSAKGWTSSGRILLVELQGSSDKQYLRIRFVLGPGDASIRNRYFKELVDSSAPTTKKKTITDSFTRLGTRSVRVVDLDENEELQDQYNRVLQEIERFSRDVVLRYDEALSGMQM